MLFLNHRDRLGRITPELWSGIVKAAVSQVYTMHYLASPKYEVMKIFDALSGQHDLFSNKDTCDLVVSYVAEMFLSFAFSMSFGTLDDFMSFLVKNDYHNDCERYFLFITFYSIVEFKSSWHEKYVERYGGILSYEMNSRFAEKALSYFFVAISGVYNYHLLKQGAVLHEE